MATIPSTGPFQQIDTPPESRDVGGDTDFGDGLYQDVKVAVVQTKLLEFDRHSHDYNRADTLKDRFWKIALKWWLLEGMAWMVSLLALVGITILLGVHEGHPSPDTLIKPMHITIRGHRYEHGGFLTINALLSLLATLLKGALLFPVAAALSQLKWTWFTAGRPLSDFQMFDSASRGTLGAVMLLWSFKGRRLASLGAFLILATLILDFSIQNLVSYPLQPVKSGQASIARTDSYNTFPGGIEDTNIPQIGRAMLGAINTGIFDQSDSHGISPVCPTGNCTFSNYKSLGVCSQCFDVTQKVNKYCSKNTEDPSDLSAFNPNKAELCTYSLPNGLNISEWGGGLAFAMSGSVSDSIHFEQLEESGISIFTAMNATWIARSVTNGDIYQEITDVNATECGLWFCETTYQGQIINGTFSETILDTDSDVQLVESGNGVNVFDNQAICNELSDFWVGEVDVGNFFDPQLLTPSGPLSAYVWRLDFDDLKAMMASLATSMTTQMRNTGTVGTQLSPAIGSAWKDVPFVSVQWQWITVPATLLILALIFLVLTAIANARQGSTLWKGSSLAAFYHPLTNDGRQQLGIAQDVKQVEKIAENLNVRWANTPRGWRLIKDAGVAC